MGIYTDLGPGDFDDRPTRAELRAEVLDGLTAERDEALAAHSRAKFLLDEVSSERDRLARILAVERGDTEQAPSGWRPQSRSWSAYDPSTDRSSSVHPVTQGAKAWWTWVVFVPGGGANGRKDTALEAMEAADRALVGVAR